MKKVIGLFMLLAFMLSVSNLFAQEEKEQPKPGWLVFRQNIVKLEDWPYINKILDSITVPIMTELIDEGKLIGWGQLNHAWGDEWNLNLYYITESHGAFIEFWNEFVKRISERYPDIWGEWAPKLQAHKDNMYFVQHMLMRD
ncbi:MAG: hypothetical protein R3250_06960 [Melioribacteraceae bacterium]|nr:hypothetical protein [Melioribacteraceae bacterium]